MKGLAGSGAVDRFANMMRKYELIEKSDCKKKLRSAALAVVGSFSSTEWKSKVKEKVLAAAARDLDNELHKRGLDLEVEYQVKPRWYVSLGGYQARYGVQWRWSLFKDQHNRFSGAVPFVVEPHYDAYEDLPAVRTFRR